MPIQIKNFFYIAWASILVFPFIALGQGQGGGGGGGQGGGGGGGQSGGGGGPTGITNPLGSDATLESFIRDALGVVRNIGFLVAVFFIVYAGFLFVTARGSEEKLKKAKSSFLWAIVGTAILLGAWVLATILEGTVNQIEL